MEIKSTDFDNKMFNIVMSIQDDKDQINHEEKKLSTYEKIIDLANKELSNNKTYDDFKNNNELLKIIHKNSDFIGLTRALILFLSLERENDFKMLYKESLLKLQNILNNYKKLAEELGITNSLELSQLFTYMLWNGFYSISNSHTYELKKRLLLPGMHSFDVIKGHGVCLAYSELLYNYLTACDKKSAIIQCKTPKSKDIKAEYRPKIHRNINVGLQPKALLTSSKPLLSLLINKYGNHAVNLIQEDDKMYVYDSTNLVALNINDDNNAPIINGSGTFKLKPLKTLSLSPNSDPHHLFPKIVNDEQIAPAYTSEDIKTSFEKILDTINNNLSLLNDSYANIHQDLEFIDKQTNDFGNTFQASKLVKIMKKNSSK